LYLEFWEDDEEIRLEDERAWLLYIYFESDRNPHGCSASTTLRMWVETETRRPRATQIKVTSAGWGKRNVVSHHFTELALEIMDLELLFERVACLPSFSYNRTSKQWTKSSN
jgi:hypothetical protein